MRQLFKLSSYFLLAIVLGACSFADTETAPTTPTLTITTTATRTPTPTVRPALPVAPTVTPTPTLQPPEPPPPEPESLPPPPPAADPLERALQMWIDYLGYTPNVHPTWVYDTRCRAIGGIACVWYYSDPQGVRIPELNTNPVIYLDPVGTVGWDLSGLLAHEIGHVIGYGHEGPGLMSDYWLTGTQWCGIEWTC